MRLWRRETEADQRAREAEKLTSSPRNLPLQFGLVREATLERTMANPSVGHTAAVQTLLMHRCVRRFSHHS